MNRKLDPITIEVFWKRLINICDDAAAALIKTSFSSVVRDFHDFALAVFDEEHNMLVHSTHTTPGLLGALPGIAKNFAKVFPPQRLNPGDVLITNDPWLGTGHLIDITVYTPIFYNDKIFAYAACVVHHLNVGGRFASPESNDIYEEGLKIPITKACMGGELNEELFKIIASNVRVANQVIGDIRAQINANESMNRLLIEFIKKENLENLKELTKEIITRSERSMRAQISAIPDTTASCELVLDNILKGLRPVHIKVEVSVRGSDIILDFAGTSDQVPKAINCPYNMTRSYAMYPVKCMLDPEVPNNEGCLRPIRVLAPEGSILNCTWPAATFARTMVAHLMAETVIRAMSKVVPEKSIASSGSNALFYLSIKGKSLTGKEFMAVSSHMGGFGARFAKDGPSCTAFPHNVSNIPIEVNESGLPVYFQKKTLLRDSGGPGKYRGGCGQEVTIKVFEDDLSAKESGVTVSMRGGRLGVDVDGFCGGMKAPDTTTVIINGETQKEANRIVNLFPGDELTLINPGGGGCGNPHLRDPEMVKNDVLNEIVSIEMAQEIYKVAIDPDTLKIDYQTTNSMRAKCQPDKSKGKESQ